MSTEKKYTTKEALWKRLKELWQPNNTYHSLVRENTYIMKGYSEFDYTCTFEYESRAEKQIKFDEIWAMYQELYRMGNLPRNFMRDPENALRIIGKKSWGAPGAAMYALLPKLDSNIKWDGKKLYV